MNIRVMLQKFFKLITFVIKSFCMVYFNTCDYVFFRPQRLLNKVSLVFLYLVSATSIILYSIQKLAYLHISNHIVISLDIIFLFSALILVMYHVLKEPQLLLKRILI
jgi:hypothetical protein